MHNPQLSYFQTLTILWKIPQVTKGINKAKSVYPNVLSILCIKCKQASIISRVVIYIEYYVLLLQEHKYALSNWCYRASISDDLEASTHL